MDVILILLCLYLIFQNTVSLAALPLTQWGIVQYLLVVVSVALAGVVVLRLRLLYKRRQEKKALSSQIDAITQQSTDSDDAADTPVAEPEQTESDDTAD